MPSECLEATYVSALALLKSHKVLVIKELGENGEFNGVVKAPKLICEKAFSILHNNLNNNSRKFTLYVGENYKWRKSGGDWSCV